MSCIKKFMAMLSLTAIVIVGQGIVPDRAVNTTQGKLLARRAAIVDVYRQLGNSHGVQILNESFNGKKYVVEATR